MSRQKDTFLREWNFGIMLHRLGTKWNKFTCTHCKFQNQYLFITEIYEERFSQDNSYDENVHSKRTDRLLPRAHQNTNRNKQNESATHTSALLQARISLRFNYTWWYWKRKQLISKSSFLSSSPIFVQFILIKRGTKLSMMIAVSLHALMSTRQNVGYNWHASS